MKKTIAILAIGIGLAVHADYLYWMVDTTAAEAYEPYTAVRLTDGTTELDKYEFAGASDLKAYQADGGYFELTGSFNDSQSFFVELYNGSKWLAQSAAISYSSLLSSGSLIKSGGISPVSGNAASFGTYNVPEPTSGLLFIIGGMLLGLKRKRQV